MKEKTSKSIPVFLMRVVIIHTLTYFFAGAVASNILGYKSVFNLPVIRDYMLAFGSASVFWGPFIQPVRGLIIGLVLMPFRSFLGNAKYGWFYLWLIFIGIGIVATPAAAPSSIEGMVYTKLPLWYHFFGLPEILTQTFAFSIIVHQYMRHPEGILDALPVVYNTILQSFAGACFAFIGYAFVSIVFAIVGNADINAEANMSLRVQGLFIAPFICNFLIITFINLVKHIRQPKPIFVLLITCFSNSILLALYQSLFLGGISAVYVMIAPILPAVIISIVCAKKVKVLPIDLH